jgi:23S rRNA (uridine2552-2'-O)-methyltransferase
MRKVRDHYFHKAKQEGFAARSAYKLEEIDRKQRLLRPGLRVLDLGCAPGSWLQYAASKVGERGEVVGIDLQPVTIALPATVRVIQGDVFSVEPDLFVTAPHPVTPDSVTSLPLQGKGKEKDRAGFDLILSDMAPKTTGVPTADAARSADLALRALELAGSLLKPGGDLLVKVFEGARFAEVRAAFRESFERVTVEKPKASRSESVEVFLLGRGFRGPQPPAPSPEGCPPDSC